MDAMSCNSVYVASEVPTSEVAAAVLEWPDLRGPRSYSVEPTGEDEYPTAVDFAGDGPQVNSLLTFLRERFPGVSIELEASLDAAKVAALQEADAKIA